MTAYLGTKIHGFAAHAKFKYIKPSGLRKADERYVEYSLAQLRNLSLIHI